MKLYLYTLFLALPFSANALTMYQSTDIKSDVTYSQESLFNDRVIFSQQYQHTNKASEGLQLTATNPCKGKTKNKSGENCEDEYQATNPKVQVKEPETPARPATLPTNPKKPATLPAKPARPAGGRK